MAREQYPQLEGGTCSDSSATHFWEGGAQLWPFPVDLINGACKFCPCVHTETRRIHSCLVLSTYFPQVTSICLILYPVTLKFIFQPRALLGLGRTRCLFELFIWLPDRHLILRMVEIEFLTFSSSIVLHAKSLWLSNDHWFCSQTCHLGTVQWELPSKASAGESISKVAHSPSLQVLLAVTWESARLRVGGLLFTRCYGFLKAQWLRAQ